MKWTSDHDRMRDPGSEATGDLVCVNDVKAERVRWLWPGRLPLGKLAVFDGDPGVGKSTVTLTIAAAVTTGSPFPDGTSPPSDRSGMGKSASSGSVAPTVRDRRLCG
jgi:putative DNA primase/helicase